MTDLEPPKIANCPDDIHKTSKDKWTKIFFPGVTVTDNVGVHLVTTDRINGSAFTWGEHNVTYSASDIAGNTAKCHFQVVVLGMYSRFCGFSGNGKLCIRIVTGLAQSRDEFCCLFTWEISLPSTAMKCKKQNPDVTSKLYRSRLSRSC